MPSGLFHADRKARILTQRLAPLLEQGLVSLDVELAARADQLCRILRHRRPDVLHMVCHGSTENGRRVLLLEDRKGQRHSVDAEELRDLLAEAGVRLELAILEACNSSPIAETLASDERISAAIGIAKEIETNAATRFFLTFHEAWASGRRLVDAFADARRDLELLAPSIWSLPVLHVNRNPRGAPSQSDQPPIVAGLDIDPSRAERYVSLAESLRPPPTWFGRAALLDELERVWLEGTRRIVHLRGPAGMGKTTILARWLELQAQQRWPGATRVFAWSFDPLAEGDRQGTMAAFLEQALDFFGAVDPVLDQDKNHAADRGEWLDGLRLGRCVARERALLCLDAVPLLPHSKQDAHGPYELLPPAIAALLHELSRSVLSLCIMTTRATAELRMDGVLDRPLEPLDAADAAGLLVHGGVIAHSGDLHRMLAGLDRRPATLVTLARAAKALGGFGAEAMPTSVSELLGQLSGCEALLSGLRHGGGSLSFHELRAIAGLPHDPELEPSWDELDDDLRRALRRVCAVGIARVTDRSDVVLCEAATMEQLPRSTEVCRALAEHAARAVQVPLVHKSEIPRHFYAVQLALQLGVSGAHTAVRSYVDGVCQRGANSYGNSFLTRELGAIADDLQFLAEFFVPGDDGSFAGVDLRPGVAQAEPAEGAYFHHRLGLALRHMGRPREAARSLQRAFDCYSGGGIEERAATCANDHAEAFVWQSELVKGELRDTMLRKALEIATIAVEHAGRAERIAVTPAELGAARLVQMLCIATSGHIHDQLRDVEAAAACFDRANAVVRAYQTRERYRWLFSRPGHQYWCFVLDRLERMLGEGRHDTVRALIFQLESHLDAAETWQELESKDVARVTRAYHALARGRLLLLACKHGLDYVDTRSNEGLTHAERAQKQLFSAVHVLRANQYLWMLPEALGVRARLFAQLGEVRSAELDVEDAYDLVAAFRSAMGADEVSLLSPHQVV